MVPFRSDFDSGLSRAATIAVSVGELNRRSTRPDAPARIPLKADPATPEIELNPGFRTALDLIEAREPVVFVTGEAGTGKSTLIHYLRETTKRNLAVVAPTGVAALNAKGMTIHSFFGFPARPIDLDTIRPSHNRTLYEELDILVIDEVSMVRADLMDAIECSLRVNRRRDEPFGGLQVVFVGDLFQLPPVVTTEDEARLFTDRYTSPYFFSAESLQPCGLRSVELTEVYRQRDERFLRLLSEIREPRNPRAAIEAINDACVPRTVGPLAGPGTVTLACTNHQVGQINDARLDHLHGPSRTYLGQVEKNFSIQQEKLPAPYELVLKVGAQVMFTKNNRNAGWVNGTVGIVKDMSENMITVEVEENGSTFTHYVGRETWESYRYRYDHGRRKVLSSPVGEYHQFPLMLAWAVTIHKAQGKTLDRILVDLGHGAFAPGQVYVALSRCRTLDGITLVRPIHESEVKCSETILRFYEALRG